ncbi:hypothetical protein N2152v2_011105 [Parachlorella kessleri]
MGANDTSKGGDGKAEVDLYSVDSELRFGHNGLAGPSLLRKWLHIDEFGRAALVEVDKHRLVQDLCIRYRDVLTLDPTVPLPYPACLLIREKALVVNLETVRMIICANQCYLLSVPKEGDPRLATTPTPDNPFVKQLCHVLCVASKSRVGITDGSAAFDALSGMPYELRALEIALQEALRLLDSEVSALEQEAYPAIDRLAVGVSRAVLEDVRAAKSTTNRLIGRVSRAKEELEDILGDDADMQASTAPYGRRQDPDMYLRRRAELQGRELPAQPSPGPSSPRSQGGDLQSLGNLVAFSPSPEPSPRQQPQAPPGSCGTGAPGADRSGSGPGGATGMVGARAAAARQGRGGAAAVSEAREGSRGNTAADEGEPVGSSRDRVGKGAGWAQPPREAGGGGGGPGRSNQRAPQEAEYGGRSSAGLHRSSIVIRTVKRLQTVRPPALPSPPWARSGISRDQGAVRRRRGGGPPSTDWQLSPDWASPPGHRDPRGSGPRRRDGGGSGGGDGSIRRSKSFSALEGTRRGAGGGGGPGGGRPSDGNGGGEEEEDEEDSDGGSVYEETVVEHPTSLVDPHDIEEAEDLLEAYFMQVDYLLRRLMLLKERTDDTEDLVNIEMDHRRNELVALDLLITCVTMAFTFIAMVAGILGMNLYNAEWESSKAAFIWIMVGMCSTAILLLVGVLFYIRKKRLMFISTL